MTAMSCFLEESEAGRAAAGAGAGGAAAANADKGYMDELWRLAQAERESLLQVLQRVGRAARAPEIPAGVEFDLGAVVSKAVAALDAELGGGRVEAELPAAMPKCCGDAELIGQLVTSVVRYAARSGQAGGKVCLGIEPGVAFWGTTAVRLRVRAEGATWSERDVAALFTPFAFPARDPSELGLEMLLAFYIVFQHGGDIAVRPGAPDGPGFEVLLPTDPAQVRRPRVTEAALTEMRG
jgi:K+-sensing histidine kinase KdpD